MAIENNMQLISYLAAAEIYNQGQSLYSCFQPIIESALLGNIDKESISFLALQQKLRDTFHLNVPKSTLRQILENMEYQGKLRFVDKRTVIPYNSELNTSFWDGRKDRERAVEEFFLTFNDFLIQKGVQISLPDIKEQTCCWLYLHSLDLASFISNGDLEKIGSTQKTDYECHLYLPEFLLNIREHNRSQFSTFLLLYNGAVQSSLLNFETSEINAICEDKLKISNVILDTNFLLRLLDLQSDFDCKASTETLALLKAENCNLIVLKQTLEEIQNSVKNFLVESEPYTSYTRTYLCGAKIRATGFWEATRRGVTRSTLLKYTQKEFLKEQLSSLGNFTFVEDFDDSCLSDTEINDLVASKARGNYGEKQARHDLSLIDYCRKKRKKGRYLISDIEYWVLTNDERLTYWSQMKCDQYQECLTEIQFCNLSWIQRKKVDGWGLIQTIISLSSSTALSTVSIQNFALKVQEYQSSHKNDATSVDRFALVFASNMITTADIQRIGAEDDAIGQIVEEKIGKIKLEASNQQTQLQSTAKENEVLKSKNSELHDNILLLSQKLELSDYERQKDKYRQDLNTESKQLAQLEKEKQQYDKLLTYYSQRINSTARILCLMLACPVCVLLFICYKKIDPPHLLQLKNFLDQIPDKLFDIGWNLFTSVIIVFVYYFLVVLFFAAPISPKELFTSLQQKLMRCRVLHYARKEEIPTAYCAKDLNSQSLEIEQKITNSEQRIKSLSKSYEAIQEKIDALKKQIPI